MTSSNLEERMVAEIKAGRPSCAMREETGCDLKAAKDAVDKLAYEHAPEHGPVRMAFGGNNSVVIWRGAPREQVR